MPRIFFSFALVAMAALAQGQSSNSGGPQTLPTLTTRPAQSAPAAPQPVPDTAAALPAAEPVITIHGLCGNEGAAKKTGAAGASSCDTVITKEQFDKLLQAVAPPNQTITAQQRRDMGRQYAELLAFADAAQKAGMEKDPKFLQVMRIRHMQTLVDMYNLDLQEKYKNPPPPEIEAYYNQNAAKYQEVKVRPMFIPRNNPTAQPTAQNKEEFEKKAQQLANDIRERAAKGEDVAALEKEAYTTLGITSQPLTTDAVPRRKGQLAPQEEEEVFALAPGEVSKVEQEPGRYVIYKMESKQTLPLDQVKDEIAKIIFRQKMEAKRQEVSSSVHSDLNDQYFGPAPASAPKAPAGGPAATAPHPAASTPSTPNPTSAPGAKAVPPK